MARQRFAERRMCKQKAPPQHTHIALCLNYTGSAFRGLQIQAAAPTHHTVEGVVLQALTDIGLVPALERGRPQSSVHHFARACRTDRGVHAIRNLVSLFVHRDAMSAAGGCEGVQEKLNAVLLPAIRVARVSLVMGNFIPRHCCNRRVYRYMLPAYALLAPSDGWSTLDRAVNSWKADVADLVMRASGASDAPHVDFSSQRGNAASGGARNSALLSELQEKVERCNKVIGDHFVGFHRFHNFSVDTEGPKGRAVSSARVVQPDSEDAARVVYRCEIAPRVYLLPCQEGASASKVEFNENCRTAPATDTSTASAPWTGAASSALPSHLPFVLFQIEGGSFLFNMIRKIVGSTVAVCRGASTGVLADALSPERRVCTPLAPGSYLYLALSTYHGYDATVRVLSGRAARARTDSLAGAGAAAPHFQPIHDEWSGDVACACEMFAADAIARDIVDADLGALPPLEEMLAARDRARTVTRPQWVTEDAHLSSMKEYTPEDEALKRARKHSARVEGPARVTEMTAFLRLLRVHNWAVRPILLPPDCKAMLEVKNKKKREEAAAEVDTTADGTQAKAEGAAVPDSGDRKDGGTTVTVSPDGHGTPDGGEDGWVYVAESPELERRARQEYFASRWKRSRPWEHSDGNGSARGTEVSTIDGVSQADANHDVDESADDVDDGSSGGSE